MSKGKAIQREDLENIGSLITLKGSDACLGDLWFAEGHGCYDPTYGAVPVSKEEASAHNAAYDKARLEGLDNQCELGQGAFFYVYKVGLVKTFSGTVVSDDVTFSGQNIIFWRKGRTFMGRKRKDDCVFFKRTV